MNTILYYFETYILVPQAHAASPEVIALIGRINDQIINPFIVLLFTAALVLFTFGMYNFFGSKKGSEKSGFTGGIEQGKRHMLWGIVGMAIMVSVFGIMNFLTSTLGVPNVNPETSGDVSGLINVQ